jgi:hypothetical protein
VRKEDNTKRRERIFTLSTVVPSVQRVEGLPVPHFRSAFHTVALSCGTGIIPPDFT